jgi:glycerate kinase
LKILIAPDKFKGSLTAIEVCDSLEAGLVKKFPDATITKLPLADGGEGTFAILLRIAKGRIKKIKVQDPLFRSITASYGISNDGKTAFIEMAEASGLHLLARQEQNPLYTTTIGTGQLIADAISEGVHEVVLGIGGSATNDAGIGMAQALGFGFLSSDRTALRPIGQSLEKIATIDSRSVLPELKNISFTVLCDVTNPLFGPTGSAHVYGPQKGASQEAISQLDLGLRHFADLVKKRHQVDLNFPGSGAAGGLGAGARFFLNAQATSGIAFISELVQLEKEIEESDVVITGEGRVDWQTFDGKVVAHVATLAQKHQKKLVVFCGQCLLNESELKSKGIENLVRLAANAEESARSIEQARQLLEQKAQEI